MNRAEWQELCAKRLVARGGLDAGEAAATAIILADTQEQQEGPHPVDWDEPDDAADEEMSCWGD